MEPKGTIIFSSIGRPDYGFDVFSVELDHNSNTIRSTSERRLTDAVSINFNAQFVDDEQSVVFISEKTGSARIFLARHGSNEKPEELNSGTESLFHDRPTVKNNRLYFVSAHEQPDEHFKSWSALYTTRLGDDEVEKSIIRLTPYGEVDYSPAISRTGKFVAVASYGSRPWGGEFHELYTDIIVFKESDPSKRVKLCDRGGWPSWSGDSTIYFHRQADDGWWSIFGIDFLSVSFDELSKNPLEPYRVTPPGIHCFTPAAFHDGKNIAVATRRRGNKYRHVEIFNLESKTFDVVTESLNPGVHHFNPFTSPDSKHVGYHRFRGEMTPSGSTIPHLEPVMSPIKDLNMIRLNGSFPSFSPDNEFIVLNQDFVSKAGLNVIKSDGSKKWTLIKDRVAFCNAWSPTEKNVIYSTLGPIFASVESTVQIARITFDYDNLDGDDDREDIPCDVKILTKQETGNNAFPSTSPDGKSIVFRSGRSGYKNIYVVDAVNGEFNGEIRRLTDGPWIDTMPSWSPDGELVAFSSNMHNPNNTGAFSIYVIKSDGSDLRRIHVAGLEGCDEVNRERINHVCFSKDGDWLLFTANLGGVNAEPVSWPNQFQPYGDLYVVRLDGSGLRRLTWDAYENGTPTWHSGDDVYFGTLGLKGGVGDQLKGEIDEPFWITFPDSE